MKVILSDIHGNLEALTAVLADIDQLKKDGLVEVQGIYNLGDTLGYGPSPVECLDLAMEMTVVLMGNHDWAVLNQPNGFSPGAEMAIDWSRTTLQTTGNPAEIQRRMSFLGGLPDSLKVNKILLVHGSPRNPTHEYLFPDDVYHEKKMTAIGECFDRLCFCGHTHVPGIFHEKEPGTWEFIPIKECERGFKVSGESKVICNVGSVGQPRDQDERACYVLFDGEMIWFRRVPYDIKTTISKIKQIDQIMDFLGERLLKGR